MRVQFIQGFYLQRRFQQPTDFVLRVDIRLCSLGAKPQKLARRDFGSWISACAVARKTPDNAEATCPRNALFVKALSNIFLGKFVGDVRGSFLLHKCDELV